MLMLFLVSHLKFILYSLIANMLGNNADYNAVSGYSNALGNGADYNAVSGASNVHGNLASDGGALEAG